MSRLFGGGGGDREREQRARSGDERERARQEREARRAAREGRAPRELPPLPDAPTMPVTAGPLVQPPVPIEAPQTVVPPEVEAPSPPAPDRRSYEPPEPASEPRVFEPPSTPEPAPVTHVPAPAEAPPPTVAPAPVPPEPEPPEPEAGWEFDEPPQHPEQPASVVVQHRTDKPVGVKRVAASALASAAGAAGPPRFGAPPRGVPRRRRGARRVIPLLFLAGAAAAAFFLFRLYEPGAGAGEGRVDVTVPPGSSAEQIGELLADNDVVASRFFFSLRARLSGDNLRAGKLALRRGMSYGAALAELTRAPPPASPVVKVTLPEGPSRKELAGRVKAAGLIGSYVRASRRSSALDPGDYGAPRGASLEGFLFPATYELKPGSSAKALVTQQLRTFKRELAGVDMTLPKRRKLTRFDLLTIASMIEREAGVAKDRRLISGVIYNRLKQRMPLGIDATLRYDLENFSAPLKVSELERDTPYNTRTRTGLPPGPIGNPGLASIQAAANPAKNDFVYYVVKPCTNGAHVFSSTDAKFQRDVAAYNKKRDELGGKAPSRC